MMIESSIIWRLSTLRKRFVGVLQKELEPVKLNAQQFIALRIIAREPEISPSAIAERLQTDRPAISRSLRVLREAGWIESRRSSQDARHDVLEATAAGRRHLAQAEKIFESAVRRMESRLSAQERQQLLHLLDKFETEI
jgi:DNA-binding MarR family transcriptional regulator